MAEKRIVRKHEASEKNVGATVVRTYFLETVPNLGLATAAITGTYPPENEGTWAVNERVDEMYYVIEGSGKLIYQDRDTIQLEPESAVHIPRGLKYRLEEARGLRVVVPTGPAWSADQHKWSAD
jgi:mannose-6-phosphate isomerase-like protein (cupin superfamily)